MELDLPRRMSRRYSGSRPEAIGSIYMDMNYIALYILYSRLPRDMTSIYPFFTLCLKFRIFPILVQFTYSAITLLLHTIPHSTMSRSAISLSRIAITRRGMQTGGRHVPNPGQGGAPPQSTISPHTVDPSISSSSSTYIQPSNPSPTPLPLSPAPRYTAKSKIIPSRPARKVPVSLPNGDPEPLAYPPTQEYFDSVTEKRKPSHPLWQFFHLDAEVTKGLTAQDEAPRNQGSLEALEGDEDNVRSGTYTSWG